jgi:quinol monooxygenase YgiN
MSVSFSLWKSRSPRGLAPAVLIAVLAGLPAAAFAECNAEEVGYVATFQVREGSEADFEAAITALAETVNRVEEGVVLYAPFKGADNVYYMMERYESEAARQAHGSSEEVRAHFPGLGPLLTGPADVRPVSAVCP